MKRLRRFQSTPADSPLAAALVRFREDHQLSFRQMIELFEISEPTLSTIIHTGTTTPRTLKHLAAFFQWTEEEVGMIALWEPPKKKRRTRERRDAGTEPDDAGASAGGGAG